MAEIMPRLLLECDVHVYKPDAQLDILEGIGCIPATA